MKVNRGAFTSSKKDRKSERMPDHLFDMSVPAETKKAIYQITTMFPVEKPYSSPNEWQKVLSRFVLK
jgi:hypothetical protein